MKKSFTGRRVPRKIGNDEDEIESNTGSAEGATTSLKRPATKTKTHSQVRRHGAIGTDTDDQDEEESSGIRIVKRSGLSRIAIQRTAGQRSSFRSSELPDSDTPSDNSTPTYNAADLQALKENTRTAPSEPGDFYATSDRALQLTEKFGSSLAKYGQGAAIPSAAEIAEKKARRARLALEQKAEEYISLDPDDPGWEEDEDGNVMKDMDGRLVLREKDRYGIQESRLVRDDEDVMEGFDEYTGDSGPRISMGNATKVMDLQARKNDISRQIAEAEGDSDAGDADDDENARNIAFEEAQTRHGTYHTDELARHDKYAAYRAMTPPIMTPIPTLEEVVKGFRSAIAELEARKSEKEAEMLRLSEEKSKLKDDEDRVQRQLKEVAEKFRQIRIEKGLLPKDTIQPEDVNNEQQSSANGDVLSSAVEPVTSDPAHPADGDDEEDDNEMTNPGLGLGYVGQAPRPVEPNEDDDEDDDESLHRGLGAG